MTGQDAVNTAKAFHDALPITGVVLTRMDGDARGGAALSMRAVTGAPIKLIGVGEKQDALDDFHPERVAGRILGMGDIVGLVEKVSETVDQDEAEKLAAKMARGKFDLEDYASQLRQITKMGSMSGMLGMLPGVGKMKAQLDEANIDQTILKRHAAIIGSMTKKERKDARHHQGQPQEAHRRGVRHVGAGCQQAAEDVRRHDHDDEAHEQARAEGPDAARHLGADAAPATPGRSAAQAAGPDPPSASWPAKAGHPRLSHETHHTHTIPKEIPIDGTENSPRPRGRQEAALLPHRGRRQPLPARRPLHREARQLQPHAASRACRPRAAAGRAHPALDEHGALPTDRVAKFLGKAGLAPMPALREQPIKSAPGKKAQERAKAAAPA